MAKSITYSSSNHWVYIKKSPIIWETCLLWSVIFNYLYNNHQHFKSLNMKKLDKEKMKKITAGGEICLECAIGYVQVIIQGRCYCVPEE